MTNRAAVGDYVALGATSQRILFILAVAAVHLFAVATVAIDAMWQEAICILYHCICILWEKTDNIRLSPDKNVDILIHGTVRYWASTSPRQERPFLARK